MESAECGWSGERFFISVTIEEMFHGAFHSNKVMPQMAAYNYLFLCHLTKI